MKNNTAVAKALLFTQLVTLSACMASPQNEDWTEKEGDNTEEFHAQVVPFNWSQIKNLSKPQRALQALKSACNNMRGTRFNEGIAECECDKDSQSFNSKPEAAGCSTPHVGLNEVRYFGHNIVIERTTPHIYLSFHSELKVPHMRPARVNIEDRTYFLIGPANHDLQFESATKHEMILHSLNEIMPPPRTEADSAPLPSMYFYEPQTAFALLSIGAESAPQEAVEFHPAFHLRQPRQDQKLISEDLHDLSEQILSDAQALPLKIKEAQRSVYEGYEFYLLNQNRFTLSDAFTPTVKGCLELCDLKWTSTQGNNLITYTKRYIWGSKTFEHISVRDRNTQELHGLVILNPGRTVAFALLQANLFSSNGRTKFFYNQFYDRNWNRLFSNDGEHRIEPMTRYQDKLEEQRRLTSERQEARGSNVLVCDQTTISQQMFKKDPGFMARLMVGPEPLNRSLLGWLPNASKSDIELFSGLIEFFSFGVPKPGILGAADSHMKRVALSTLDHPSRPLFAAMDIQSCLQRYNDWKTSVSLAGVQIINMSSSEPRDSVRCEEDFGSVLNDEERPFLWVLAAGNDGQRGPTRLMCPQNLPVSASVLKVAAVNRNKALDSYSNYGESFIDIAADGTVPLDPSTVATSIASPRAATVAASIASRILRHIEASRMSSRPLTTSELRLSLILGAQIPVEQDCWGNASLKPLPVRSGGVVSEGQSLAIAHEIIRLPPEIRNLLSGTSLPKFLASRLLTKARCGDYVSDECRELLDEQFKLLLQNGVIDE